jgi:hypothetical protein
MASLVRCVRLVRFAMYLERDTGNFFYQYILTPCSPW